MLGVVVVVASLLTIVVCGTLYVMVRSTAQRGDYVLRPTGDGLTWTVRTPAGDATVRSVLHPDKGNHCFEVETHFDGHKAYRAASTPSAENYIRERAEAFLEARENTAPPPTTLPNPGEPAR